MRLTGEEGDAVDRSTIKDLKNERVGRGGLEVSLLVWTSSNKVETRGKGNLGSYSWLKGRMT